MIPTGAPGNPDWAFPASAASEATHGNTITPLVTLLLMDQGKAGGESGQGDQSVSWEAFKDLFKI